MHPRIFGILDAVRKAGNFGAHLKVDPDTEELFFVANEEARLAVRAVVAFCEQVHHQCTIFAIDYLPNNLVI